MKTKRLLLIACLLGFSLQAFAKQSYTEEAPPTSLEITKNDCIAAYQYRYQEASQNFIDAYLEDCKRGMVTSCILMPVTGPIDQVIFWTVSTHQRIHLKRVLNLMTTPPSSPEYQQAEKWFYNKVSGKMNITETAFTEKLRQFLDENGFCERTKNGGFDNLGPNHSFRFYYSTDALKRKDALKKLSDKINSDLSQ